MNLLLFIICFMYLKNIECPEYLYWLGLLVGFSSFTFRLFVNVTKWAYRK